MKSGWISVNDRLPDNNRLKVVRYSETWKGEIGKHIGIALSRYYLPSNQTSKKFWCFEFGSTLNAKITHWMPLPSPPKET